MTEKNNSGKVNFYDRFFKSLWDQFMENENSSSTSSQPFSISHLELAKKAKKEGDFEKAAWEFREAITENPTDDRACLEYARLLIEQHKGIASEEFLALALQRNPCNHDALELYLEVLNQRGVGKENAKWAFDAMATHATERPEDHRGILDYVITERLDTAYETLRRSPDIITRASIALNDIWIEDPAASDAKIDAALEGLSPAETQRALSITMLGRGKVTSAVRVLRSMGAKDIPMNSLRRAIRNAIAQDKIKRAITYLNFLSDLRPQDMWVRNKLTEFTNQPFSNAMLWIEGFPFPEYSEEPTYSPVEKKVFYLLHNSLPYSSAGYSTRTHGLLHSLNQIGWDVDGVTRLGYPYDRPETKITSEDIIPKKDIIDGVDYHRLNQTTDVVKKHPLYYYIQNYSAELKKLAEEEKPQIIHAASNHWNGLTAVKTARELGIPSVYEVRGLWEVTRGSREPQWWGGPQFSFMAQMEAEACIEATAVITITEALKTEMISRGVPEEKIVVVPNGVDTERFVPMERDEELAYDLGVSEKTVIGYVGSILDYEGIDMLIEATEILAEQRDDFHVLIVGDGAKLEELQNYVIENGFQSHITFTGRVPHEDVERYYSIIDITPLPRHPLPVCEMVSPLKPFEAMAMGKTILGSDVDAIAEIIKPGINGFLHEKGNVLSLVKELNNLLDNPSLVKSVGKSSRRWVVENRNWYNLGEKISELYNSILR